MWKFVYLFVISVNVCSGAQFENYENNVLETMKFLIPTLKSNSEKCREHSIFYLKELKDLRLWATESKYLTI